MPLYSTINLHPHTHGLSLLTSDTYDVICLGSGWAANVTAARLSKAGLSTLLVESELFGGECPYWACVPSKALLRPGELFDEMKSMGGVKEKMATVQSLDVEGVFERRDTWTFGWDDDKMITPKYIESGAHLVRGRGTLIGVRSVKVEDTEGNSIKLQARHAVLISTGSEAVIPDIPGLLEAVPWTPRQATTTSQVPQHLAILGAGAVGCEMVSTYVKLGAKMSLISSTAEILPRVDAEAGAVVRKRFTRQGVDVYLSARVTQVRRDSENSVTIELADQNTIKAAEILVSVGRRSRTEGLGLEQFDVPGDGGPIPVDDCLRVTTVPDGWLYAVGDVNGRAPFSHTSKYHGRVVASAIISNAKGQPYDTGEWSAATATADKYAAPQVIFTIPSVASVGLTRKAAEAQGRKIKEIIAPVKTEGAELRMDGFENGWAQWIIDEASGKLLGATFVGDNVADLLHASTVAIVGEITLQRLAHAVPSFPTMSEVYLNLLEAAGF